MTARKKQSRAAKRVLVSGDCVCDHNVYKGKRRTADSSARPGVVERQECGGAMQLQELIEKTLAVSELKEWETSFGFGPSLKELPADYHAFCLWGPHVSDPSAKEDDQYDVWRAVEPPLGYGQPGSPSTAGACGNPNCRAPDIRSAQDCDILVLDDAGLGFRNGTFAKHWAISRRNGAKAPDWVVLKLSGSVGEGDLWKR